MKDILYIITKQGYEGKVSNFYDYCKKLMEENDIEYHTSKNTVGAPINRTKLQAHFVNRKDIFDFLWMNNKLANDDKEIIFKKYPILYHIHTFIREFREIFIKKSLSYLYLFIEKYQKSVIGNIRTFVNGLLKDIDAIENAVTSQLSNGFLEGGNNRLKMIKRMMYGRARLPLLRAKCFLQVRSPHFCKIFSPGTGGEFLCKPSDFPVSFLCV